MTNPEITASLDHCLFVGGPADSQGHNLPAHYHRVQWRAFAGSVEPHEYRRMQVGRHVIFAWEGFGDERAVARASEILGQ